MCNLYSSTTAVEAMRQLFEVDPDRDHLGNAEPRAAIWPKYTAPVVRLTAQGNRELVEMDWGFLTRKVSMKTGKELKPAAWNNARGDKVRSSGLWRDSFENRRCLVPASSFREAKGRNPATDVWFALAGDEARPPFAFAGLWRTSPKGLRGDDAKPETHTILTTSANELVATARPDRMPFILAPADYATWLTGSPDDAAALIRPFPAELMRVAQEGVGVLSDEG